MYMKLIVSVIISFFFFFFQVWLYLHLIMAHFFSSSLLFNLKSNHKQ